MRDRTATRSVAIAALVAGLAGPARALDLDQVMREVADAGPAIAAGEARAEASRRRVAPAGAWDSPMLELGVANVPTSGRFDEDMMTMKMVGVSQRVPVFGANGLRARAASAASRAESADATLTRYEAFGAAWEAYADFYHAGALARHAEAHRSVMDRLVEAARARYAAGRGRLDDVLRSEAERARMLADIAAFRAEAIEARSRLDALRGVSVPREETLEPPPSGEVPAEPDAWLAAVTEQHPRLLRFEASAAGSRLDARAARRSAWPDLELRGSYGFREPLRTGETPDDIFGVSVGFMLPLFAGGRELSEAAAMDAVARATEADLAAARLDVAARVRSLHAQALASERTSRLLADTVVVVQERALEASRVAYEAGTTDLWRVFEASHMLYQEHVALERALQQRSKALAGMLALTGRGDLVGVTLPEPRRNER